MTALAQKINAWLTPSTRKAIYAVVALVGTLAVVWGIATPLVAAWTALALAVGGLLSGILATIMARRLDITWIYGTVTAVVAALVVLRFVKPDMAQQIDLSLSAVVTLLGTIAFARTDTGTFGGSPRAEVIFTEPVVDPAYVPPVPIPVPPDLPQTTATANADGSVTDVNAAESTITPGV